MHDFIKNYAFVLSMDGDSDHSGIEYEPDYDYYDNIRGPTPSGLERGPGGSEGPGGPEGKSVLGFGLGDDDHRFNEDRHRGEIPQLYKDNSTSNYKNEAYIKFERDQKVDIANLLDNGFEKNEEDYDNYYKKPEYSKNKNSYAFMLYKENFKAKTGLEYQDYVRVSKYQAVSEELMKRKFNKIMYNCSEFLTVPKNLGLDKIKSTQSPVEISTENKQFETMIENPHEEGETSAFWDSFIRTFFPRKYGFNMSPEIKSGTGRVDSLIKHTGTGKDWVYHTHVEYKCLRGKSFFDLITQNADYVDNNKKTQGTFGICIKGQYVTFFIWEECYHSDNHFHIKGDKFNGLLGLYFTGEKNRAVKILPQFNTYYPQLLWYDISKDVTTSICVKALLAFASCYSVSPLSKTILDGNSLFFKEGEINKYKSVHVLGLVQDPAPTFAKPSIFDLLPRTIDWGDGKGPKELSSDYLKKWVNQRDTHKSQYVITKDNKFYKRPPQN